MRASDEREGAQRNKTEQFMNQFADISLDVNNCEEGHVESHLKALDHVILT